MPERLGSSQYEYADMLRAVGNYLDTHGFRNVTILVVEDGMLLTGQALVMDGDEAQLALESYVFTADDLDASLAASYARRGCATPSPVAETLRYEDLLRVAGEYADAEGWRHIELFQTPGTIHAKGYVESRLVTRSFSETELRTLVETLGRRPKARQRWPFR